MKQLITLVSTGVRDAYPQYVQNKIKLANSIVLLLLAIVIPYGIAIYFTTPELVWIPVLTTVIYAGVVLANRLGFHFLSRLILSTTPQVLLVVFQGMLMQDNDPMILSLIIFNVSLFIFPWILFDLREYPYIITASLLGVLPILGLNTLNIWLDSTIDASLFQDERIEMLTVLLGISIVSIGLYFLQSQNLVSEKKAQQLVSELDAKNKKYEASEANTQQYLKQIEEAQQLERQRSWASEGLAKFGAILRATDDVQQTYDTIISELVRYLEANQGGLYIVENSDEEDEKYIKLASCYAYERKKFVEQKIAIGEGLLGQAYLEKETIFMTDIPESYIRITSGLGRAIPRSIVIVPLMMNEQVEGLFELASFRAFEPHQLSFLKDLGEGIASAVVNHRITLNTRQLLEQTRQQTEALRAQEEEVRQNMEEMQATQEEMSRKEQEYQNTIAQLKAAS